MHALVVVVGDNPVDRAKALVTVHGTPDWAGIGGRYTGQLVPVDGATTAIAYGDTLPPTEATLTRAAGGFRPVKQRGHGVDQLRRHDLDLSATMAICAPAYVLTADDQVHESGHTANEDRIDLVIGVMRALKLGDETMERALNTIGATSDDMDALRTKSENWHDRAGEILNQLPVDALITLVDIHV